MAVATLAASGQSSYAAVAPPPSRAQLAQAETVCSGLESVSVLVDSSKPVTAPLERSSEAGGCRVGLIVTPAAGPINGALGENPADRTCFVTATPSDTDGGIELEVTTEGSCSWVVVRTSVDVGPRAAAQIRGTGDLHPGFSGHEWLDARIWGHDPAPFHNLMLLVYQQIDWDYDGDWSSNESFWHWEWADALWNIHHTLSGTNYTFGTPDRWEAYNWVHFTSFGGIGAYLQPTAWAWGDGGWNCTFYHTWVNPVPGFHWHDFCRTL